MRIAIIVQRYGPEIVSGSEHHCRLIAERLAAQHDVDVLTTCARDAGSWKNEYAEGADRVRGVTVRRFRNSHTRNAEVFERQSEWILSHEHSRSDELEWLKQQGPWSPGLIEHLRRSQQHYDVFVFFSYMHATTVLGLEVSPTRSILVPAVPANGSDGHSAVHLDIYYDVFSRPAAILYNTDYERRLVQGDFPDRAPIEEVVGVGIDIPQHNPYPRMPAPAEEEPSDDSPETAAPVTEDDSIPRGSLSHVLARGAVFRRRHRLDGRLLLYSGRIEPGGGCEELMEYFSSYVDQGGDATLALMGTKLMSLPENPRIRFGGMLLSDRERLQALEAASIVACPSPSESLPLLALEAFSVGTPVLANARNTALVEHCAEGNGGLYYADRDEFVACLDLMLGDTGLRMALGRNGRDYIRRNFRWETVLGKYERVLAKVRNAK